MKIANYSVRILLSLTVILIFCCLGAQPSYAADLKVNFYPAGDKQVNPVSLLFKGKLYPEGWWFDEVAKGVYPASDDEKCMIKIFNTLKNGTQEEILNLWAPSERDAMKPDIFNANLFSGSRGYYKNIQYAAFMAKIEYGSYIIFLVQHTGPRIGDDINDYIIRKIDGNYYQTNDLKSDPVALYITQKYGETLSHKIRKAP